MIKKLFAQGTLSILLGAHSPIHYFCVLLSWKIIYHKWPCFYEFVCIFIHDIGHFGLNYLDSQAEKDLHWYLGARIARFLFGQKGYNMIAGHDRSSGYPESKLYRADKYAWFICPRWVLVWNCFVEPKLAMGYTWRDGIKLFTKQVKKSIESGEFRSTHEFYVERCKGVQK